MLSSCVSGPELTFKSFICVSSGRRGNVGNRSSSPPSPNGVSSSLVSKNVWSPVGARNAVSRRSHDQSSISGLVNSTLAMKLRIRGMLTSLSLTTGISFLLLAPVIETEHTYI